MLNSAFYCLTSTAKTICSLWQTIRQLFDPSVSTPVLVNDGSIFVALGVWAAWQATSSDPTLPLGAAICFSCWKLYDKRTKRNPGKKLSSSCVLHDLLTNMLRARCRRTLLGRQCSVGSVGLDSGMLVGKCHSCLCNCQAAAHPNRCERRGSLSVFAMCAARLRIAVLKMSMQMHRLCATLVTVRLLTQPWRWWLQRQASMPEVQGQRHCTPACHQLSAAL